MSTSHTQQHWHSLYDILMQTPINVQRYIRQSQRSYGKVTLTIDEFEFCYA